MKSKLLVDNFTATVTWFELFKTLKILMRNEISAEVGTAIMAEVNEWALWNGVETNIPYT